MIEAEPDVRFGLFERSFTFLVFVGNCCQGTLCRGHHCEPFPLSVSLVISESFIITSGWLSGKLIRMSSNEYATINHAFGDKIQE